MAAMAQAIVAYVTCPSKEVAMKLSKGIIENRLAACVNSIPGVTSTYLWEGKVETDTEELLMIKTRKELTQPLTKWVTDNHPYDVPEVITVDITGGSEPYLKWVQDETANAKV